jgi:hypothetical protein
MHRFYGILAVILIGPVAMLAAGFAAELTLEIGFDASNARTSGFVEGDVHYVLSGKPPTPRAVPAGLWRASYAAQTVMFYATCVLALEIAVAYAAGLVAAWFGKGACI